jgi:hypothetical protein
LASTLAASALITCIALYPLRQLSPVWFSSLKENLAFLSTNGGTADVSPLNRNRFDRIDLQQPLFALTHSRASASPLAGIIAAILLISWFIAFPRDFSNREPSSQLLGISTLLVIGLLPVYQRYYTAILLVPAILWAFRNLSQNTARWTLALSAVFLINTEALLRTTGIDDALVHHLPTLTEAVLGPHLCWLVLALACILLLALRRPSASPGKLYPE